ncbi:MAG: periplasmic protein [Gammaproteobacteria bacterium BRH_c0]|nr:MAG: periplasmic protein [Gammaproteobacteria bacterium BRH_c0]
MEEKRSASALVLGVFIFAGLATLGYLLGKAAIDFRQYERSVTVKGLAEREFPADVVIWPLQFTEASNNLEQLYTRLEQNTASIKAFLRERGVQASEISVSPPAITDKSAQAYNSGGNSEFRYTATQAVTVYSTNVDTVRPLMNELATLGKQGIVFTGNDYQARTEYLFNSLNDIKPAMIEEATTMAREVAEKFAADSNSRLGKIKNASQGQFTISDRDSNNPHIKNVRVVSTVEYYLSD